MSPILSAHDLAKSFGGVQAVAGVSLAVEAGEVVALIGPNGAGKTTTFNIINGQTRADRGRVEILGRDVTGLVPRELAHRGVGRTFQITATFASMSVVENVQVALMAHRRETAGLLHSAQVRHRSEAEALLARVGMAAQAARTCGVLAYGDMKRVELAMALAGEPKLLLMDEPTAGMAPPERTALMELAVSLARTQQIGILFTEHDMDAVFAHASRIIVMDRGRIIAAGSPREIRADARVREVYLGSGAMFGTGSGPA